MTKSNAQSTVEFAIRSGLAENAHLTGVCYGDVSETIVQDVLKMVFERSVRWATKEYLRELEMEEAE